nr:uncharacterized protein LOC113804156 [Penaeus vannamei]
MPGLRPLQGPRPSFSRSRVPPPTITLGSKSQSLGDLLDARPRLQPPVSPGAKSHSFLDSEGGFHPDFQEQISPGYRGHQRRPSYTRFQYPVGPRYSSEHLRDPGPRSPSRIPRPVTAAPSRGQYHLHDEQGPRSPSRIPVPIHAGGPPKSPPAFQGRSTRSKSLEGSLAQGFSEAAVLQEDPPGFSLSRSPKISWILNDQEVREARC